MTISFGHKDKQWKSRYTFTPKMMVSTDKTLISQSSDNKLHTHNDGAINTFYGSQSPSGIGVAFNDNISANKIFKTVSVEGTESLESAGHVFYPYRSTDASRYYKPDTLEPLKVKGGMLYGKVGRDRDLINGATMHYVGMIKRIQPLSTFKNMYPIEIDAIPPEYVGMLVDGKGSDYVPEAGVRYGLFYNGLFYFGEGGTGSPSYTSFNDIETFDDIPNNIFIPQDLSLLVRSEPFKAPNQHVYAALAPTAYPDLNGLAVDDVALFAFKDPSIHGGDLRGQRAEMFMSLGSEDFELYGINLNYEPVNADHTK